LDLREGALPDRVLDHHRYDIPAPLEHPSPGAAVERLEKVRDDEDEGTGRQVATLVREEGQCLSEAALWCPEASMSRSHLLVLAPRRLPERTPFCAVEIAEQAPSRDCACRDQTDCVLERLGLAETALRRRSDRE